jgi:predicted ATP-grasp superfamily ATP-dependent carboligase
MIEKKFIDLEESAKSIGARVYLIKDVEVYYDTSMLSLIKRFAHKTTDYNTHLLVVKSDEGESSENKSCDFLAICWPNDGDGGLEKANKWAEKKSLKTISSRELVSICRKKIEIYWDLNFFDIIKLVSTNPILGQKYLTAQIEAESDVIVYPERVSNMTTGDHWFVFRVE